MGRYLYRHQQFTSGNTVDGYLEGNVLGPDSRGTAVTYAFDDAPAGWGMAAGMALDDRSGDVWAVSALDPGGRPTRIEKRPDEVRVRPWLSWTHDLWNGRGGVALQAGLERVRNWAYRDGERRTNTALLVRAWRGWST